VPFIERVLRRLYTWVQPFVECNVFLATLPQHVNETSKQNVNTSTIVKSNIETATATAATVKKEEEEDKSIQILRDGHKEYQVDSKTWLRLNKKTEKQTDRQDEQREK
jgi:hypothetical protein